MALEIDAMFGRISRHKGVSGVLVFNTVGTPIKNFNVTDVNVLNLLSYLSMRMKKVASEIVSDLAKAHLEVLRIHTEMHEYVLCFEEDYVVIAIYNQPNERDDGVKEEIE